MRKKVIVFGITLFGGVSKPILANKFVTTKPVAGVGMEVKLAKNMKVNEKVLFLGLLPSDLLSKIYNILIFYCF